MACCSEDILGDTKAGQMFTFSRYRTGPLVTVETKPNQTLAETISVHKCEIETTKLFQKYDICNVCTYAISVHKCEIEVTKLFQKYDICNV